MRKNGPGLNLSIAKSTAVSQVISVKRMLEKLAQESVSSDFSPQEATIIREAKK